MNQLILLHVSQILYHSIQNFVLVDIITCIIIIFFFELPFNLFCRQPILIPDNLIILNSCSYEPNSANAP